MQCYGTVFKCASFSTNICFLIFPQHCLKLNFVKPQKTPISMKAFLVTVAAVVVGVIVADLLKKKVLKMA